MYYLLVMSEGEEPADGQQVGAGVHEDKEEDSSCVQGGQLRIILKNSMKNKSW